MVGGSAHIVPNLDYDIIAESDLEKHSWLIKRRISPLERECD